MELETRTLRLGLRRPLRTAHGTIAERELLAVTVRAPDGAAGIGEAAPLEPYDGVAFAAVAAEIEACRPMLAAADDPGDPAARAAVLAEIRAACTLPQAAAALDVAVWDLAARRSGVPLAALLDPSPRAGVAVNATLGADAPAAAGAEAAAAAAAGFRCVKVKAGTAEDVARVLAVRAAAGPDVAIRIDANGAWTPDEAARALAALAPAGIEICEEPVHGVAAFAALAGRTSGIALALDETAAEPGALTSGSAPWACLKLTRCGGVSGLLADAATARAAGSRVYLASTLDGPVGIAAALHAAAAIRPDAPSGLATLDRFADVADAFPPHRGEIACPREPGLGVSHPE